MNPENDPRPGEISWDDEFKDEVRALRHDLHRHPELSGLESTTAERIEEFFKPLSPDRIVTALGGNGIAVVFCGNEPGPTVLLRCELDALPIVEGQRTPHRSMREGIAHLCGHDGHMAILAAVGKQLSTYRPSRGTVVLLFQPAEETGEGAAAILGDPKFQEIKPELSFALHNLPGFPLGQVLIREGSFSAASRGMCVKLTGSTTHAAQPETGISPANAMCRIIERLTALGNVGPPDEFALVTVVGAELGKKAFGTAPGYAEIWSTLRTETNACMEALVRLSENIVKEIADQEGLERAISYEDVFLATVNSPRAVEIVRRSAEGLGLREVDHPFRWSEDFGRFTENAEGALFGVGSGEDRPDLHSSDYDFPDELTLKAAEIFMRILKECLS